MSEVFSTDVFAICRTPAVLNCRLQRGQGISLKVSSAVDVRMLLLQVVSLRHRSDAGTPVSPESPPPAAPRSLRVSGESRPGKQRVSGGTKKLRGVCVRVWCSFGTGELILQHRRQ